MGKAFIQESTLIDIANSIRTKLGVQTTYLPSEMPDAIDSIPTGGGGGPYNVLCFTAEQANSTVYLRSDIEVHDMYGLNFQYSYDNSTWNNWTYTTDNTSITFSTITLSNIGDKVYIRGNNASLGYSSSYYSRFYMSGKIAASGNIQSLLTYEADSLTAPTYCYYYLFNGCHSLTSAPLLPAKSIGQSCYQYMFYNCTSLTTAPALPATRLAIYCYAFMFQGCTSLTAAPVLPATILTDNCYQYMFYGCTALTTAPDLPSTSIGANSYSYMFYGCTALTTVPEELPATTLPYSYCYSYMFYGCTALTTAPKLPATNLSNYCYSYMFRGCTALTIAPELPATTLQPGCYQNMFQYCSSLTTAPVLPATTLVSSCYNYMFQGCSRLNCIKVSATSWNTSYTNNWVSNVASTGIFIKPDSTSITTGASGIPSGWNSYYFNLFYDYSTHYVTIDTSIPSPTIYYTTDGTTPTTSSTQYSASFSCLTGDYGKWINCLVTASGISFITKEKIENLFYIEANSSSTVQYNGQSGCFQYSTDGNTWTNYTNNSSISLSEGDRVYFKKYQGLGYVNYNSGSSYKFTFTGSVNVGGCLSFLSHGESIIGIYSLGYVGSYTDAGGRYMFYQATALVSAENLIVNIQGVGSSYNNSMFYGCTALTKPPKLPATLMSSSCYSSMFQGCTSLTTAPELPATTLASDCYTQMFYNCTLLNKIKVYATSWNTSYSNNWVVSVNATGDFYKPSDTTIPEGNSGIPTNWTVHNF